MAKRSDFAQKLLDDLRIRKERMAAPAQTSNRSNATAIDAYAYSKQTHKESRETRVNGTISTRTGTSHSRSTGNSRPIRQESSNQMVAYGSGGGSGQVVDLSMALAFALENGATKFTRTSSSSKSSVMGFLNQISRGAMDFSKMERKGSANRNWGSRSQFPNLSNFHIEEISKGAQKLNQILRAFSSGVKADAFSIEIGKELFKGAVDLEESLRMLVNLQEASEYMTSSQRKSRITLLDEDEDDEENKEDQKQVDLPRFSFDRTTRHARRTDFKAKMAALTCFTGGSIDDNQGRMMSTSASQKHSVSYLPDVKNPSKLSGHRKSNKPEKDRIPSVIAKLMGLDELPKNESMKYNTTQKDNSSKQKSERSVKTKDIGNLVSTSRQKVVEGNKNPLMLKTPSFLLQVENVRLRNNVGLEMVIHDGKQAWTDFAASKPVTGSGKTTIKIDKQQIKQNSGKDHHEKERKQDSMRYVDKKLQVRKQYTEIISESAPKKVVKQPLPIQARMSKKTMAEDVGAVKSKGIPNGGYHENLARRKSPTELNIHKNDSSQKKVGFAPVMKEKPVHHAAQIEKEKIRRVDRTEIPRRMDEVVARRNRAPNKLTRPLKESTLQEATHRNHDKLSGKNDSATRLKQVEPHIVKSNKSAENTRALEVSQNQHKQAEASTLYAPNEDEFRGLQELQPLAPHESCQNSVSVVPNDQQDQAPIFGDDDCISLPNTLNVSGTHEDTLEISQHRFFKWRKQEPLTETEIKLKQILIGSQMFLNTAEALFRLEIPFGILHDSIIENNINRSGIDSKLKLDCSYEVMKRRGRRQELSFHPNCVNVSLGFVRIESLDELVKQLCRDMEALRMYGKNGRVECAVEEYVPKMLEIDVNNWEGEVNCMWHMGWDVNVFGIVEVDEVVRDLERLVFSGLVDEVARELFHTCTTAQVSY